jgi:multiple sugar transport system substrate-binding protein
MTQDESDRENITDISWSNGAATRRSFLQGAAAGALTATTGVFSYSRPALAAGDVTSVDKDVAAAAKALAGGKPVTLRILEPSGSLGNVKPVAENWKAETGIDIEYIEVPLGEINQKILLEAVSKAGSFDIALPASFGIPDLVESGILVNLDKYAQKYEPEKFRDNILYSVSDYYKGNFYGYQTDGDAYVLFYRKDWLQDADAGKRYADKHGKKLQIPETWEDFDHQLAFFHHPDKGTYGGTLFRTQYFIAWEWWIRFHAKGFYPFSDDLTPQINNEAGIKALEELVAASKFLYPGARTNGLFENFEAYGKGDSYANIGWGGTQKYLNSDKSNVSNKLVYGPTPGGIVKGKLLRTPYFNWGWNYVVSSLSQQQEIAYLFTLYAASPRQSTIAVRDIAGYFDPFRAEHYKDPDIIKAYSKEFLDVQEASLRGSIPDLYLKGQGEYFDALRINIQAVDTGQKTPKEALNTVASEWDRISRRLGRKGQQVQWLFLKSLYPNPAKGLLA